MRKKLSDAERTWREANDSYAHAVTGIWSYADTTKTRFTECFARATAQEREAYDSAVLRLITSQRDAVISGAAYRDEHGKLQFYVVKT